MSTLEDFQTCNGRRRDALFTAAGITGSEKNQAQKNRVAQQAAAGDHNLFWHRKMALRNRLATKIPSQGA